MIVYRCDMCNEEIKERKYQIGYIGARKRLICKRLSRTVCSKCMTRINEWIYDYKET